MGNIAATAERTASKGLRFFFAPQLFLSGSMAPLRNVLISFVQMIAQFLLTAELIPATHRSLRPVTGRDARLGEVLALAWHNLRKPGTRVDQYAVFFGVVSLLGLISVMALYTLFSMLIGSAHAGISIVISFGACTFGGMGTSYFTTTCAGDMAQTWIDALFLGQTPWWTTQTALISPAMQAGLGAMFQTYSYAMLILAGFLVLYHLLIVIAGTAHEGRLGGKIMNQVWAPIRLVAAIGMLVPLGVNGLNSGQMIALQVTKWGSGLASNTWMAFANTFTNSPYVILPPLPQTVPALKQALLILVCQNAYNSSAREIQLAWGTLPYVVNSSTWKASTDTQKITKTWDYYSSTSTDSQPTVCGKIEMLNPNYMPNGTASQFLTSSTGLDASIDLRKAVLTVQRDAIDAAMASGSRLDQLAQKIYESADSGNTNVILTITDILSFNLAVGEYRSDLATGVRNAVVASTTLAGLNMTQDAMTRGWMSAGIWFNSIAKINGMLIDYTKAIPNVQFSFNNLLPVKLTERTNVAYDSAIQVVNGLSDIAATSATPVNEPLSYTGDIKADSPIDKYLLSLAQKIKGVLGNTTASTDETGTGTLNAFASGLALNTANPLAELTAIGHRMVEAAFTANRIASGDAYEECRARLTFDSNGDDVNKCEAQKPINPDSLSSMIIQMVGGALITSGITLAFVLPMLPFVRFLFGILTWVVSVFETVIAIPVVALAHIRMDGDGFTGQSARSAYMLLLQVFLRPVLMVFGLIVALIVFNLMIVALNEFYSQAVRSVEGGGGTSALAAVVYTVVYVSLAYGLANASFKAIDMVPNQCLQWIGGATQQSVDGAHYLQQGVGGVSQQASPILSGGTANQARQVEYYNKGRA